MIFEARTYTFQPGGAMQEWIGRFGEAYKTRQKYSPLYAFLRTEIGPLNQVVHIWAYDSLQKRADIREEAAKDPSGNWPPKGAGLLVNQENDILIPIEGMKAHTGSQELGGIYELRMYTYPPGALPKVAETFAASYAARAAVYPVGGIWTSDLGNLNRLYQLFPYKDWDHRDKVRTELREKGIWPPHAEARPVAQLVRHMVPSAFSPLH
jgi:NIPSNAP